MALNPLDAVAAYNAAARSAGARGIGANDPTNPGGLDPLTGRPLDQGGFAQALADIAGTQAASRAVQPGAQMASMVAQPPAMTGQQAAQMQPGNFTQLIRGAVQASVATVRQGEQMSMQGIAGQADLRDVVMAVANAEITLQTVVAVRDKVVNAYNEILKLPI